MMAILKEVKMIRFKFIFSVLLGLSFFISANATELTEFTEKVNTISYKIGNTNYRVRRILDHAMIQETINISYACGKSNKWIRYYYKYGTCKVESSEFDTKDGNLKIKYFSHDLSKGDEYVCEKEPKFLEYELDDRCAGK